MLVSARLATAVRVQDPPTPLSELVVGCGDRLTATRLALGFVTQTDFAESLGITVQRLNQWEHEKHPPDIHVMARLKRNHFVSLDWIYMADPSGLKWSLIQRLVTLGAQNDAPVSARRLRTTIGRDPDSPAVQSLYEDPSGFREDPPTSPTDPPRKRRGRPAKPKVGEAD
ncbi:helix-turn-helix domain-containing protein [Roseomonas sp. F4]